MAVCPVPPAVDPYRFSHVQDPVGTEEILSAAYICEAFSHTPVFVKIEPSAFIPVPSRLYLSVACKIIAVVIEIDPPVLLHDSVPGEEVSVALNVHDTASLHDAASSR